VELSARLARLEQRIAADADALAGLRSTPEVRAAETELHLDEVLSSVALGGYVLDRAAGAGLLARGVALGDRQLVVYEAVADYAQAADLVRAAEPYRGRDGFLRADEVLELHRRAMRRSGRAPGAWRERNLGAVRSGLVPPPHWLVPREVAAFVDRVAPGPPPGAGPLLWIAGAHARLLRIQPFDGGNGRVARLVANLLLARLGLPPAAYAGRRAERYAQAIARADGDDLAPLAELTAMALHEHLTRLLAARSAGALFPLRQLVPSNRVAALVKAAQRGRLRVVRRGARFLTSAAWLEEYERSTANARR
jgi:Fic/DOC family protein